MQPFGNSLVTMTLTGAQIDRVLEQQWDGQGTNPKVLQVSKGLTDTWSASAPLGSRVDDASIKINGTSVDPPASYRVTSTRSWPTAATASPSSSRAPTASAARWTSTRWRRI